MCKLEVSYLAYTVGLLTEDLLLTYQSMWLCASPYMYTESRSRR
jgi:hypothetical protein